jgi:hypothetical protein
MLPAVDPGKKIGSPFLQNIESPPPGVPGSLPSLDDYESWG